MPSSDVLYDTQEFAQLTSGFHHSVYHYWRLIIKLLSFFNSLSWQMHIRISRLTIIGSDNGLSPGWWQAIIWTNSGIFLIGPSETNFREIFIEIYSFIKENAFENVVWKMEAILSRPQCVKENQHISLLKHQELHTRMHHGTRQKVITSTENANNYNG